MSDHDHYQHLSRYGDAYDTGRRDALRDHVHQDEAKERENNAALIGLAVGILSGVVLTLLLGPVFLEWL